MNEVGVLLNFNGGIEQFDAGRCRGTTERIGRITVSVKEGTREVSRERGKDLLGGEGCGQRKISTREPFR